MSLQQYTIELTYFLKKLVLGKLIQVFHISELFLWIKYSTWNYRVLKKQKDSPYIKELKMYNEADVVLTDGYYMVHLVQLLFIGQNSFNLTTRHKEKTS